MARKDTGVDYSNFLKLVNQAQKLADNFEEVADEVLEVGAEAAKAAYKNAIPRGDKPNPQGHAQDEVYLTPPKNSKRGSRYRVVRIKGDRSYLYMIDYGVAHEKKTAHHPWREKAENDVYVAAGIVMEEKLSEIIDEKLS